MEARLLFRFLSLGALGILLTGCAAVAPLTSAITGGRSAASGLDVHGHTETRLQEANFVMVRTNLVGQSKGFKLLGLITLHPATLNKAMGRLYANAQAQQGTPQTLANLMVEHSEIYLILFSISKVNVRADLIEFLSVEESSDEVSPAYEGALKPVSLPPRRRIREQ